MSAREPDVLDRNLEALLRRSWEPVLPTAEFSARLERELAPWTSGRAIARPRTWWMPVAAAALVLAALMVGWRVFDGTGNRAGGEGFAPIDTILAQGEIALRELPDGGWRAATPDERRAGIAWFTSNESSAGIEVATPSGSGIDVRDGEGLELALDARTRVRLGRGGSDSEVQLSRGWIDVRAGSRHALVSTSQGSVRVADATGTIAFETVEDAEGERHGVRVTLFTGRARLDAGAGAVELESPGTALMHAGSVRVLSGPSARERETSDSDGGARREPLTGMSEESGGEPVRVEERVPPEQTSAPSIAALTGSVRELATDEPIAAFELTLLRAVPLPSVAWPESRSFEAADGRFEWDELAPGEYTVSVQAEGHCAWRVRGLQLGAGEGVDLEVVLGRGASLRGAVVDGESGLPIAGALVVSEADAPVQVLPLDLELLPPEVRAHAITGADGIFVLENLTPGPQMLRANGPLHAQTRSQVIELREGERLDGTLFELGPGGALEGIVQREGGLPRVDARVIVSEQVGFDGAPASFGHALTDEEGAYRIEHLAPGHYVVLVSASDEESDQMRPELTAVEVLEGETVRADFLRETNNASLVGHVRNAAGEPLGKATINLVPIEGRDEMGWRAASVQPDGRYSLGNIQPGTYEVYVGLGSGLLVHERLQLEAGEARVHDLRLDGNSLAGRVTDARTGELAPGYVLLLAARGGVDAGSEIPSIGDWIGKSWPGGGVAYEFPFLEAGLYDILAFDERGEYALQVIEAVEIAPGRPARVDIELARGGGASVLVLDGEGHPVHSASIELRDPMGRHIRALDERTDGAGIALLEGLMPGVWHVVAKGTDGRSASASLVIDAGLRRELQLVLRP